MLTPVRSYTVMRLAAIFVACALQVANASENNSSLPYRARDGWLWDPATGMWRSPRPTRDPHTHKLFYETRLPSSTTCCDQTGLYFPDDAANSFDDPAPHRPSQPDAGQLPAQNTGQPTKSGTLRAALKRRLEEKERLERQYPQPDMSTLHEDGENSNGAGQQLYGNLSGMSADQLNSTANGRRRDPSNDPTLLGIMAGGFAVGSSLAGAGFHRTANTSVGRQTVQTRPATRPLPSVPSNPFQSDISGTK